MRINLLFGIALFSILLVSAASAACPDGMVSYWKGEGNGNNIVGTNIINLFNGATYSTGVNSGTQGFYFGSNVYMNGAYAESTETIFLSPNSDTTFETWFKIAPGATFSELSLMTGLIAGEFSPWIYASNYDGQGYKLNCMGNNNCAGGQTYRHHEEILIPGVWYHSALVYDGDAKLISCYLNGQLVGNVTYTYGGSDSNRYFRVGSMGMCAASGNFRNFYGTIDESAIYSRELSTTEIQQHYSAVLSGLDYCNLVPAPQDADEDGVPDAEDNCVNEYNPDQHNADGDSAGDVCDVCPSDANNLCLQGYTDGANAAPTETTTLQSVEVQVIIPPGAVAEDTSVSMQRGSVGDFEICTSTTTCFTAYNQTKYSFEPEITFLQPIEIRFSYASAPLTTYNKCLNEGCDIFWKNETSNRWVPQKANCSAEPGWCVLFTDHFSDYVIGVLEYDYVGNATIILDAYDEKSGVLKTYYCIDSADTCTPNLIYTSPLFMNTVGTSYVRYYSTDIAGNNEEIASKRISIVAFCDREAPALEIILSGILSGDTYVSSVNWLIRATDALSGMKSLEYNLTQI